ncbi:MAG: hypothetical protein ACP5LD_10920 [Desulfomonilaceae bacterium]
MMKRVWFMTAVMTVLAAAMLSQALAWEFSMKGDYEWRYRYWTRTGKQDIFGEMDDTHVNLGINHLVVFPTRATTNRINTNGFGFSSPGGVLAGDNNYGADMTLTDNRMTIYPKITVNPAIAVDASVNVTSLGIWSNGKPYFEPTAANANDFGWITDTYAPIGDRPLASHIPNTFVTVQWLRAVLKTPMANFNLGYRTSSFGIGLWMHGLNRASSSFAVAIPYGPFQIVFAPYFSRNATGWGTTRITGATSVQRQDNRRNYFKAVFGAITYRSGPLEFQFMSNSYFQPSSPAITNTTRGGGLTRATPTADTLRYRFGLALKYSDGRVFFNGEADWYNRWQSGRGVGQTETLVREGLDNDAWVYGAEIGAFSGPAKVTLSYVRAMGDDPSTRKTTDDAIDCQDGVSSPYIKPWGYLMYYMYGAGDGWDAAGYGQPTNFHHAGVRIDYAIASNLNVNLVYSRAWRDQPNAYRLGGDYRIRAQVWTNEDIRLSQLGTFRGQAVPDSAREIGWETDIGVDWKLLEGLTWSTTFAYWKPGNWWSYAYPNTAYLYRLNPRGGANANPNDTAVGEANATWELGREIDGLFSVETKLLVNF